LREGDDGGVPLIAENAMSGATGFHRNAYVLRFAQDDTDNGGKVASACEKVYQH
jgi:hypothetical protein